MKRGALEPKREKKEIDRTHAGWCNTARGVEERIRRSFVAEWLVQHRTARWGSGRQGTTCPTGHAAMGFVPGRRPRHGLLGYFSCWAGPVSTACQGGRANPRPASAGDDSIKVEGAAGRIGGIRERKGKNMRGSRGRGAAWERGGGGGAWSHGGGLEADSQRQWLWQAQACSSHSSKKNRKKQKS